MKKLLTAIAILSATALSAAEKPLTIDVYNADKNSFHVNASVIYGESEALLVDTGFSRADALRIAAKVLDSGRELTTIFISQADPDYYFGVSELTKIFPKAKLLTTQAVNQVIKQKMAKKLSFWGPKLGVNAPQQPIELKVLDANTLEVDGQTVQIKGTTGELAHRPYLWVPGNKTILGNVAVFSGLHLWMADTQSDSALNAWSQQLQEMKKLEPTKVIPGHMQADTGFDAASIDYSIQYLTRFREAKKNSANSAELIEQMRNHYPSNKLPIALSIGAKVHKGEMKW